MKMNKQKQVFGVVEKVEENKDYVGTKTKTAEVIVDNVNREISVNVDITSMLGESPTTAYSGHLGAQNRRLVLKVIDDVEEEKNRSLAAEADVRKLIYDTAQEHDVESAYLESAIKKETSRSIDAEKTLQQNINNLEQKTKSDKAELVDSITSLSKRVDKADQDLHNNLQETKELLITEDNLIKQQVNNLEEQTKSSIHEIEENYADKTYVYEQLVEFTKLSKQIVDAVDVLNNVVLSNGSFITPVDGVLYLVKDSTSSGIDIYNEYTTIDGLLTLIGDTSVDLSGYATESWVISKNFLPTETAEQHYAQKSYVQDIATSLNAELTSKIDAAIEAIPEVDLSPYAKTEDLPTKLSSFENDADYAKKSDIPDVSSFIAEIPSEYITESELTDKGYYNLADITELLNNIEFIDGGKAPL